MTKTALILIVLLFSGNVLAVDSQGPTPSLSEQAKTPNSESAKHQECAAPNQRGSEEAPFVIKVLQSPNVNPPSSYQTCQQNNESSSEWGLTTATILIAVFTFGVFVFTGFMWWTTKDTARRQLRAYIGIDEMPEKERRDVEFHSANDVHMDRIEAHGVAKNFGRTPAIRVKRCLKFRYLDSPPTKDMFPDFEWGGFATIHPGNTLYCRFNEDATESRWNEIKENVGAKEGKFLYAFGWVTYFDIFGDEHFTRFCFRVEYRTGKDKMPGWSLEGPFNDTDDDKTES